MPELLDPESAVHLDDMEALPQESGLVQPDTVIMSKKEISDQEHGTGLETDVSEDQVHARERLEALFRLKGLQIATAIQLKTALMRLFGDSTRAAKEFLDVVEKMPTVGGVEAASQAA